MVGSSIPMTIRWCLAVGLFGVGIITAQARELSNFTTNDLQDSNPSLTHSEIDTDVLALDIDHLGEVDVVVPSFDIEATSVTPQERTVGKSPAAIFVITQKMIRRNGANSIPSRQRFFSTLVDPRNEVGTFREKQSLLSESSAKMTVSQQLVASCISI